ncbi:hypothetical protein FBY31_3908 [Arthrobacter sp. SLBN-100]|nr:hypothetical protein FBY31_3908 [Arthrobacter sp. SLBN-100]
MAQRRSIRGQAIQVEGSPTDRYAVKAQLVAGPEIIRAYSAMSSAHSSGLSDWNVRIMSTQR